MMEEPLLISCSQFTLTLPLDYQLQLMRDPYGNRLEIIDFIKGGSLDVSALKAADIQTPHAGCTSLASRLQNTFSIK